MYFRTKYQLGLIRFIQLCGLNQSLNHFAVIIINCNNYVLVKSIVVTSVAFNIKVFLIWKRYYPTD